MKKVSFRILIYSLLVVLIALPVACKKKKTEEPTRPDETFDKQAMLVNYADNVIVPAYLDFKISFDSLVKSFEDFKLNGTLGNFQILKQKLNVAYFRYQRISLFGLGPGEDFGIRTNFNVFPANSVIIEANISSGTYNLEAVSNISAKGFPALDYLFNASSETDGFSRLASDEKCKKYVSDLFADMNFRLTSVINNWTSSYRNTFVNALGTDVGSSIGFLINQINFELDYLKNYKIGIPLGLKSGGNLLPDHCEALYSGQSLSYIMATLDALEDVYLGRGKDNMDGKGFDDYLEHLGIKHLDQTLNGAIQSQFNLARTKLELIGNPFSEQVVSNGTVVKNAYNELVKLLVLLKTDMPSNLGVVITYQDGDGD